MKKLKQQIKADNLDATLGVRVRHIITGLTGIVQGFDKWLNGCARLCVKPEKLDGGKALDGHWFDIQELEIVGKGIRERLFGNASPTLAGGPREAKSEPMAR